MPFAVAHRAAKQPLEDGSWRLSFLVSHETDAGDEKMAKEVAIRAGDHERPLERPHAALGICCRPSLANGVEEPFGVDGIPVHVFEYLVLTGSQDNVSPPSTLGRRPSNPSTPRGIGMHTDVWSYREVSSLGANIADTDVSGFDVEAIDGSIGKVDDATSEIGSSYLVVDTGPWIFGKKVMLPAGVVKTIDTAEEKVFVNRTKDEIKNAPELDENMLGDDTYRGQLGSYYGPGGQAHRGWDDAV